MSTRAALPWMALLLVACAGPEQEVTRDGAAPVGSALVPSAAVARALAASLEPEGGGVLEDGLVRRRVAALAAEVAAAAGAPGCDLTVLDTTQVVARALPGGHLQVSRGLLVACAGEGAADRVAALLAHLAAHVALDHPREHLARALARDNVAALASSVAPIIAGDDVPSELLLEGDPGPVSAAFDFAVARRALLRPVTPAAGCDEADARALRALEELGLGAPQRALVEAYAAVATVEERDPAAVAPFVALHGALHMRLQSARDAAPSTVERRPAAREALDLTPLVAEVEDVATLDAADLLTRAGAPEAALRLIGERRGARAATLRGLALTALGRDREAERAWRAALLLDPASHRARVALGALYTRQGQHDAARAELDEALRRSPLDAAVHLLLAEVTPDRDRARTRLQLALVLTLGEGRVARLADEALAPPPRTAPTPPDPRRARILSGSGGGD